MRTIRLKAKEEELFEFLNKMQKDGFIKGFSIFDDAFGYQVTIGNNGHTKIIKCITVKHLEDGVESALEEFRDK